MASLRLRPWIMVSFPLPSSKPPDAADAEASPALELGGGVSLRLGLDCCCFFCLWGRAFSFFSDPPSLLLPWTAGLFEGSSLGGVSCCCFCKSISAKLGEPRGSAEMALVLLCPNLLDPSPRTPPSLLRIGVNAGALVAALLPPPRILPKSMAEALEVGAKISGV